MLPNEQFALACRAWYEEQGLIVDETNGEFAHCPQPERYGDAGYYLLHEHHQQQGLLQSKDIGECCFFVGHAKKWLQGCEYFPDNYFELWDIYEEYAKEHCSSHEGKVLKALHAEKDEKGKSKFAVQSGKKGGEATFTRKKALFDPLNAQKVREGNVRGCKKAAALLSKPVELTSIETGECFTFASTREASRVLNLNQGNLCQCALGKRKSCKGFTVRYV
jgi:hypothetical protein